MQEIIENYIYLYHTGEHGEYIVLPSYPDTISNSNQANFTPTSPLLRSAPIFSYSSSGPRRVGIQLTLLRDMMTQINYGVSNFKIDIGDDYVDALIKKLEAMSLPKYSSTTKMVDPPLVAVRFGNELFIKGIVSGPVQTSFSKPIIKGDKYEQVTITFDVCEITPYDAESVQRDGLMRGISTSLERKIFKSYRG